MGGFVHMTRGLHPVITPILTGSPKTFAELCVGPGVSRRVDKGLGGPHVALRSRHSSGQVLLVLLVLLVPWLLFYEVSFA